MRAVFGNACLDLRQARLERSAVVIDVEAVFGEVTIVVGPYVTVIVDGYAVVGDFGGNAEETQPPVDAFVVRVIGNAVFGSVNVRRKNPTAP